MNCNRIFLSLVFQGFVIGMFWGVLDESKIWAQLPTYPKEGIERIPSQCHVLQNAWVVKEAGAAPQKMMVLIRKGKIEQLGASVSIPPDAQIWNLEGRYIYPGLIDVYVESSLPQERNSKGSWHSSIHPEQEMLFDNHDTSWIKKLESYRQLGFTTLLCIPKEGLLRGTGMILQTGERNHQEIIIKPKAVLGASFQKEKHSKEPYPSSLMGSIALIRQTLLDANWYQKGGNNLEYNASLSALNDHTRLHLPWVWDTDSSSLDVLRIAALAKEFSLSPVWVKGGGREWEWIPQIKNSGLQLIVPLAFPPAPDLTTPDAATDIQLSQLRNWAYAPSSPYLFHQAQVPFTFSSLGKSSYKEELLRTIDRGLSEKDALTALTLTPAAWLNLSDRKGKIELGFDADLMICDQPFFSKESKIIYTWVNGQPYGNLLPQPRVGKYLLKTSIGDVDSVLLEGERPNYNLTQVAPGKGKGSLYSQGGGFNLTWQEDSLKYWSGNGGIYSDSLIGSGEDLSQTRISFSLIYVGPKAISTRKPDTLTLPTQRFPSCAWGAPQLPQIEDLVIRDAFLWTLQDSASPSIGDVWIKNGIIQALGTHLTVPSQTQELSGKGFHLTPGLIDEHSHIAIDRGVNEGTQAVTSEVRIGDVLLPDDIHIYHQLSGGVTTSQLLHGSANPIGGQSALIKLRWGETPDGLRFSGAPPFIKFALGENVKQSNWGDSHTTRYPQSRPGVEQILRESFRRAAAYKEAEKKGGFFRKDLELEALSEILAGKRKITCHSYVQSEIVMLMRLGDSLGFKVNTFTHVLEGYKIADKLKAHGAAASTFSDWWAYKYEVIDAIPHNGTLLSQAGVITGFNSDDAEMGRRLNQEAAKAIKYGGLTPVEALKLVTLNPAKMLGIDAWVGSLTAGKHADLVLWSDNPLSVYAKADKTWIDGKRYFDRSKIQSLSENQLSEKKYLLQKALQAAALGFKTTPYTQVPPHEYTCETLEP